MLSMDVYIHPHPENTEKSKDIPNEYHWLSLSLGFMLVWEDPVEKAPR